MTKKPPAFQFYAEDFLQGTALMTIAEVGAYIRLLARSWSEGPVPKAPEMLARWMHADLLESQRLWSAIAHKFRETPKGYINRRLEAVRREQKRYRKEQQRKALSGWGLRRKKRDAAALPKHSRGNAGTHAAGHAETMPSYLLPPDSRSPETKEQSQGAPAKAPTKALMTLFDECHKTALGYPAVFNRDRDPALLARLAKSHTPALVETLIAAFFKSPDPFIRNAGYTVGVFSSQFAKLLAHVHRGTASADQHNAEWDQIAAEVGGQP